MKQVFDLTKGNTRPEARQIIFAGYGCGLRHFDGHRDATMIFEREDNEHQMGVKIVSSTGEVSLSTVEHAKKMIEAIQFAIDNDFLFTEHQLTKYHTRVSDTRGRIKAKMKEQTQ